MYGLWAYSEFAIFILPISAHLVRISNISAGDHVLDVAYGTGNTVINAKRMISDIKVTGVDFIPDLLAQAKEQSILAEVDYIE